MIGAALGLSLWLLWPLAFVAVCICAIRGKYPYILVTPDDPKSPFGAYEETVRNVYARFGRYVGDVYWLGIRNPLYGLRYMLKPEKYKETTDYGQFRASIRFSRSWIRRYEVDKMPLWEVDLWRFQLLAGWMVRGVWNDPHTERQPINMEFRPIFSLRRKS